MIYGDESCVEVPPGLNLDELSTRRMAALLKGGRPLTRFGAIADNHFIHDTEGSPIEGLLCYRIDKDCLIEINDAVLRSPMIIRNQLSDIISFQFVSTVKRSEFIGTRKNVHNLGPAVIVSVISGKEITYRVPKANIHIRHVTVHTTLSNLMQRLEQSESDYPEWLLESLSGQHRSSRQRVFFLEDIHRDAIWSCFHLPVAGTLLKRWMSAKFDELLCVGLQILKDSQNLTDADFGEFELPDKEKIRRAQAILAMQYANPPPLPTLARQLGISETRLKSGFKAIHGTTILQYCIGKRIEAARLLLKENRHSIAEIGNIVGYEDPSAFSRAFRRISGQSPREWRRSQGILAE